MPVRAAVVDPHRISRSKPLVERLRSRVELVADPIVPGEGRLFDTINKARTFHPDRDTWRARVFFNADRWEVRTADVSRQLAGVPEHDVRLHIYPISCSLPTDRPYVVVTDNTMAVTQRSFRRWANLSPAAAAAAVARECEVMRSAAFVGAYSTQTRLSLIEDYGCDPEKVVQLNGALRFDFPDEVGRTDRQEALFVATSFWRKGGATLLEAWRDVESMLPDARLTIAGPSHRPPRNLPRTVAWLGRQPHAHLPDLYRRANVFVLPTLFESSVPNVIREAMAFGLPVVASDVPGIALDAAAEVVLVPTGDASALGASLVELLATPVKAEALGRRARHIAAGRYSVERLAEAVADLLERAVSPQHRKP